MAGFVSLAVGDSIGVDIEQEHTLVFLFAPPFLRRLDLHTARQDDLISRHTAVNYSAENRRRYSAMI